MNPVRDGKGLFGLVAFHGWAEGGVVHGRGGGRDAFSLGQVNE